MLPCSLDDDAEQGSCGSREKFSVLLQVVNGFETLVDKSRSIFSFQLKCYPLVFKVTKRLANL